VHDGDVGLLQDFIAEAIEHLDASEAHLLTIEADPHEIEALNAVFRAFHTIKGLAGFAELDHIQELAHRAENLLDMARKQEIELRGLPMDLVFESVDMMKRLIEGVVVALAGSGYPEAVPDLPLLLGRLQTATSEVVSADPAVDHDSGGELIDEVVPEPEPPALEPEAATEPSLRHRRRPARAGSCPWRT
jgi:two-component system, chemotaxis family, sensor kinase CheA